MELGIAGNAGFVSASSAGLGFASAEALAREGVDVAICGRDGERLEEAETKLHEAGTGDVLAVQADIRERAEVVDAVEAALKRFGRLDHLVTSAGGPPTVGVLESEDEDWYRAFDHLVMSVVWTVKAAQPELSADGGGTIVNITSRTDAEIVDGHVLSNAVRRSVGGLMKTLSVEFAPEVRANAVLPGPHETDRIRGLAEDAIDAGAYEDYDAFLAAMTDEIPLGRVGDPAELGDTVAWLSSERASYVNGRTLLLDGGAIRSF